MSFFSCDLAFNCTFGISFSRLHCCCRHGHGLWLSWFVAVMVQAPVGPGRNFITSSTLSHPVFLRCPLCPVPPISIHHISWANHYQLYILLLRSGGLLAEHCRTDDLLPSIPISCLPPCCMDPRVLRLNINFLSQVVLGHPTGLFQSVGGLSAATMTRWWSSSGAERAKCPKKLMCKDFTL